MAKFDGKDLTVLMNDGGSGGLVAVGNSVDCTISIVGDEVDTTDKDSTGWKSFLLGERQATITTNGYTDYSASWGHFSGGVGTSGYYASILNDTQLTIRFTTNTSGDDYIEVTARMTKFESNGAKNQAAGYSVELKSDGVPTVGTIA